MYPQFESASRGLQRACAIDSDTTKPIIYAHRVVCEGIEWQQNENKFGAVWNFSRIWQVCKLTIHNPPLLPNPTRVIPSIANPAIHASAKVKPRPRLLVPKTPCANSWRDSIPKQFLTTPVEYWSDSAPQRSASYVPVQPHIASSAFHQHMQLAWTHYVQAFSQV